MANPSSAGPKRPAQAFILGWPLSNLGGVNEVVRNLIREFETDGPLAPVVVEAMDGSSEQTTAEGTPVLRLPFPAVYDPRRPVTSILKFLIKAPAFCWRLRSVCRQHSIQVLNPHFVGLEQFSLVLFRRLGYFKGRLLLSFHGSDIRSMIQSRGIERYLSRLLLQSADALIPCSEGLGQEILMLVPECAGRVMPIPNGIDIPRFLSHSEAGFQWPEPFLHRRKILSIGAFEYKKGHNVLLKAFAEVRRSHPEACLVIAGQTRAEFDATRQLVFDLELTNDVLLLQDLPHSSIGALLKSSDLFVLSSRWERGICGEGFAMALLEAAAAGRPVVSTLSCGVSELIEDGVSGAIVPPDNPELLAQAINRMLDDPEEAARQARRLHDRVAQDFTWKAAHHRYLELADQPPP